MTDATATKTELNSQEKSKIDPQAQAFMDLTKLNLELKMAGGRASAFSEEMIHLQNILSVGAAGDPKIIAKLTASDMQKGFVEKKILIIKSRLAISASGVIYYQIDWQNAEITKQIVSLLSTEGYVVVGVTCDSNLSDSEEDATYSTVNSLENATFLRVNF